MIQNEIIEIQNIIRLKLLKKIEEGIDKAETTNDLYSFLSMYDEIAFHEV